MRRAEVGRAEARAGDPLLPWARLTSTLRQLVRAAEWEGAGVVTVADAHLVFEEPGRPQKTSLRTVTGVEREGAALWVRRRNARDWLIGFDRERDARRVEVLLRRAIVDRARRVEVLLRRAIVDRARRR